jgi:hypothetical protein
MLIVHGGKDYRVPVGQSHHVRIMYETVLNFLDHRGGAAAVLRGYFGACVTA